MALRMAGDGLVTVSERRSTRPIGRPAYYGPLKRVLSALDTPNTVNERTCDRCGGLNRPDAAYCWRCYATFGAAPVPEPIRAGRIGPAASIAGDGTGPVMTTAPPAPEAPTSTGTDWGRWLVKGVVFVLAFAGGWWAVNHFFFGGFPFPDQVAGQPKVESEQVRDAAEAIASLAEILDVEMEMAFYGTEAQPVYVMFAFEIPDQVALPGAQPFSQSPAGEIPFQCGPDAQGAACVWDHDGRVVGVGGIGQTVEQLDPVARQVQAELQG
jgi:hypothetical protein